MITTHYKPNWKPFTIRDLIHILNSIGNEDAPVTMYSDAEGNEEHPLLMVEEYKNKVCLVPKHR